MSSKKLVNVKIMPLTINQPHHIKKDAQPTLLHNDNHFDGCTLLSHVLMSPYKQQKAQAPNFCLIFPQVEEPRICWLGSGRFTV
jgi:hypothetical protein